MLILFTNAVNSFISNISLHYIDEDIQPNGEYLEICTSSYSFGKLLIEGDLSNVSKEEFILLQNTVQMLAILLEKLEQERLLEDEKELLNNLVKKRTLELHERNETLKALTENSPDITIRFDKMYCHVYVSENIIDVTGIPSADFIGKTHREVGFREDICQFWEKEINKVLKTYKKSENLFYFNNDQCEIIYDMRLFPETNEKGNIESVLCKLRDVTKQKKSEDELINAKERVEESDRLKSAFLANISHEIRTPMNGIVGFLKLLNREDIDSEKRKDFMNIINSSAELLLKIISDIIEISKIEAGQLKLESNLCNLNKIILDLYYQYELNQKKENITEIQFVHFSGLSDEESEIYTDPVRLRQILTYLIDNAFKFTTKGTIQFGYEIKDSDILFSVKDTGVGITQDKAEIIFDRFRQEDDSPSRGFGGLGLGLAISKSLIELLNGKIWFETEKGSGSKFFFTIPYKPNESNMTKEKVDYLAQIDLKDKVILVVEDVDVSYELIKEMLIETNAILILAEDGLEAINICQSDEKIDLVLMDIQLPNIDGYEATRQIKKIRPKLPVIAQTAYAYHTDKEKALASGCDDFIAKPIDEEDLMKLVIKYIY